MGMTIKELLLEIDRLHREIALQEYGSMRIETLTLELLGVHDLYVRATRNHNESGKAA